MSAVIGVEITNNVVRPASEYQPVKTYPVFTGSDGQELMVDPGDTTITVTLSPLLDWNVTFFVNRLYVNVVYDPIILDVKTDEDPHPLV